MQRMSFRRLIGAAGGAVILIAVLPAAAMAAGPIHTNYAYSTPANYCGIDVIFSVAGVDNFCPVYDSGGNLVSFKDTLSYQITFTAANGKTVGLSAAGRVTGNTVTNGNGTFTETLSLKGLAERISSAKGTTLSRDAGIITFTDTFDSTTGAFISETFTQSGPHPEADSGGALFCQILTAGLT